MIHSQEYHVIHNFLKNFEISSRKIANDFSKEWDATYMVFNSDLLNKIVLRLTYTDTQQTKNAMFPIRKY